MKKILPLLFLLNAAVAFSQSRSAYLNIGNDTTLCGDSCLTLHASYLLTGGNTSTYTVSNIAYSPAAAFNSGTAIIVGIDDKWSAIVPIGFSFCFFGQTYTDAVVGSNGILTFNTAAANGFCSWSLTSGTPIPTTVYGLGTYPAIMPAYQDIDPTFQGFIGYETIGTAPFRKFIVNYYRVPYFGDPNSVSTSWCSSPLYATYQAVMYETTNVIDINIETKEECPMWNGGLAIEGIQNETGTIAYTVTGRNNTQWTAYNDAWRFAPAGTPAVVSWYADTTFLGTGDSMTVCVDTIASYNATTTYQSCGGSPINVYDTITIRHSSPVNVTAVGTNETCSGCHDGTITVTISGGNGPYSYSITPSAGTLTGNVYSNLPPGYYTVCVTDYYGCSDCHVVLIKSVCAASVSTLSTILCHGQSTGVIAVSTTGLAPYTYQWSPSGGSGQTSYGNGVGSYTCTITDATGCVATVTTTLTEPTQVTATASTVANVHCYGGNTGSVTATAGGGTPGYSYHWTPSASTSATAINLFSGIYTVTVTDSHGCSATSTATVIQPSSPLTATLCDGVDVHCHGDSTGCIKVCATGATPPYSYSWTPSWLPSQDSVCGLVAGTYTVVVYDAYGCTRSTSGTITQPTAVVVAQSNFTNASCWSCQDGTAEVVTGGGTGPYTYTWTPSGGTSATASGLGRGTYTCCATDAEGCTGCTTVFIGSPTGVEELTGGGFTIHPNPAHNSFTISVNEGWTDAELKIYDVTGREVYGQAINRRITEVNTPLSMGIYYVKVKQGNKVVTQRIVMM